MSDEWIPIRVNLPDDPAVFVLSRELGVDRNHAIGLLVRFWAWVDQHLDGFDNGVSRETTSSPSPDDVTQPSRSQRDIRHAGVTLSSRRCHAAVCADFVDDVVDHPGFVQSMRAAGWIDVDENNNIIVPHFERWFGKSGKRRMLARRRQAEKRSRESGGDVTQPSRSERDENVTISRSRSKSSPPKSPPPGGNSDSSRRGKMTKAEREAAERRELAERYAKNWDDDDDE